MFSAGGNDVFVDIGDKAWGVLACQNYLGGIEGSKTLHVGDQFLSAGANDFKVSHDGNAPSCDILRIQGTTCLYHGMDSKPSRNSAINRRVDISHNRALQSFHREL